MKGFVQIYTGHGKGKTTAAFGLALRAAGHGMSVFIGQFMKGVSYGELETVKAIPLIEVMQFGEEHCIRKEDVTEDYRKITNEGLEICFEKMSSGAYDMIILDEINVAVWFGLVEEQQVLDFIARRPAHVELILTGRYAPQLLIEQADLVTEMKCMKHYFDLGIQAREGIEM